MKSRFIRKLLTVLISVIFFQVSGQESYPSELNLEDIYKNSVFGQKGINSLSWMKDNKGYSTLEDNQDTGGKDIVRYDAKSGQREVLVPAGMFIPQGKIQPLSIREYTWSADNQKLLIFTNTRRVWRQHTRGDYWVLDINTGNLQQIGSPMDASRLMFAKFSPDATRAAYVYKNNIYAEDLGTGRITQLTFDGDDIIVNGTFDWAYEEEFGCRDGFRWSPDGKTIAYWHSNTEGTGIFYMINNIDSIYSVPIPLPYPKVGTTISAVKVGVVPSGGGESRWFEIPGDMRNNYLPRMDFIPNSNEVMIQQLNRLQNTNIVWTADVNSMELTKILTDKDEAFLDIHDNIMWLDNERYFTWTSEKDGWMHLYKISRDGKNEELITSGEFDIVRISCIDSKGGYVYYIASPDKPTERYLYRSRLDGRGQAERVTPGDMTGQHAYQISADASWAIHTFQNVTTPTRYHLVSLPGHKSIRLLEDNAGAKAWYDALNLNPKEFFRVDIGVAELDGWMIKPPGFDASKKYPVIIYIYGEPAGATVQNNWGGGDLWHQYMASQGYVVMSLDPRGTKSPRGREWRKVIYEKIGIVATNDHADGMKEVLKKYPFMDAERVGIYGHSGGGQMSMNCLFRYPEIYKAGIAMSFVSNQLLYDAIYQERYMGLPSENEYGYREGSPIFHAHKLEGELLIMHGTADDNVHYQSFEMLVDELIRHNKMFQMMAYPMRSHGISERENTSYHLRQVMERFWLERLPAGPR
jgi:dipeptidyl-peptidase-4